MIDISLIKEREKVFDDFRQINQEMLKVKNELQKIRSNLTDTQNIYNDLNKKQNYLKGLINIMIMHDCDPVEAKLKYEDEIIASQPYADQPEGLGLTDAYPSNYDHKITMKTRYGEVL